MNLPIRYACSLVKSTFASPRKPSVPKYLPINLHLSRPDRPTASIRFSLFYEPISVSIMNQSFSFVNFLRLQSVDSLLTQAFFTSKKSGLNPLELVDISKLGLDSKIKKFTDSFICRKGYSPPVRGRIAYCPQSALITMTGRFEAVISGRRWLRRFRLRRTGRGGSCSRTDGGAGNPVCRRAERRFRFRE